MSKFATYRDIFPNARLTRSESGILEVALHTDGGTIIFNGFTHEQFVELFHAIGSDPENRVVILTGTANAFMEEIRPDGFDFFTPRGYDKIYREGKKVLMNILDIEEVPLIAAVNGPVLLHARNTSSSVTSSWQPPRPSSRINRTTTSVLLRETASIFCGRR